MKTMIVGGTFGASPKYSGVVLKIGNCFESPEIINGGVSLPSVSGDLIIWMPNISNEEPKHYPQKPTGSVLVCSKLMHEGVRRIDAISRIFKMHGNAVICIYPQNGKYSFELIDALGNTWYSGFDIQTLCSAIKDIYAFTKSAVRIPSYKAEDWVQEDPYLDFGVDRPNIEKLLEINKKLSDRIMEKCGNRFFGNVSTRCQTLFPSLRYGTGIYVSPRNCDKKQLEYRGMIQCSMENGFVAYHNGDKPSVDTPVQLAIYGEKPEINYMIHGHAFIDPDDYPFWTGETKNYCLCGDMRETEEVLSEIKGQNNGALNLKEHGFLLFSTSLDELAKMAETCKFSMRSL